MPHKRCYWRFVLNYLLIDSLFFSRGPALQCGGVGKERRDGNGLIFQSLAAPGPALIVGAEALLHVTYACLFLN